MLFSKFSGTQYNRKTWGDYSKITKEELEKGKRPVFKSINVEAQGNLPGVN